MTEVAVAAVLDPALPTRRRAGTLGRSAYPAFVAKPLWQQKTHRARVHERWAQRPARAEGESWSEDQCGRCTFWVPLTGTWGLDWGLCTNELSPMDRMGTFEHDGCAAFVGTDKWNSPQETAVTDDA